MSPGFPVELKCTLLAPGAKWRPGFHVLVSVQHPGIYSRAFQPLQFL